MTQTVRNTFLDKKLIGTLFEEEEVGKKDNFHNQVARDEKGRKHWHGAFTGGFEAGYKNTCGSRDGWAPQKFISSRTNRAQYQQQSIEQFMDEEDVGKQKLGVNLTIREEFDAFGVNEENFLKSQLGGQLAIGMAPSEMVYRENRSIGYQLLQKLKRNRVQKTGFDIEIPDDLNEDRPLNFIHNDNYFGLGYNSRENQFETSNSATEQYFLNFIKKLSLTINDEEEKKKKDNRITFNGGDFGDKEDYNFELEDEREDFGQDPRKKVKMLGDRQYRIEDLFTTEKVPFKQAEEKYTIEVPKDYDPYHRIKSLVRQGVDMNKVIMVKKSKRRDVFEEEQEPVKEETAKTIRQDLDRKKFVRGGDDITKSNQGIKELYPHDKAKQQRFEHFCWNREGKMVAGIPPNSHLTTEQQQDEEEEFERMYKMFQIDSKNIIAEGGQKSNQQETKLGEGLVNPDQLKTQQNAKQKQKPPEDPRAAFFSKRTTRRWVPAGKVSMRLGVPSPYTEEEAQMIYKVNKKLKEPKEIKHKERFQSGGVYREADEETLDPSLLQTRFDPSQLGLPLSFKSMGMERSQREYQMHAPKPVRESKDVQREREMMQPLDPSEHRVQDQSLFDSIFGDE